MPIHTEHASESLEPQRITKSLQYFGFTEFLNEGFDDGSSEFGHAFRQPGGHMAVM
jgi:hypothetical protein